MIAKNQIKYAQIKKRWRIGNRERCKLTLQRWQDQNRERYRKCLREWHKARRDSDIKFRLNSVIGTAINKALRGNKLKKKWEQLVGYSLKDLMKHLEGLFMPEMNWGNYGIYWEIDHIKPKRLFQFNSPEDLEFQQCWGLANLRPLEKSINRGRPKKEL